MKCVSESGGFGDILDQLQNFLYLFFLFTYTAKYVNTGLKF